MALDPTFDLKAYVTPIFKEVLFESVENATIRIEEELAKILPRNEFLVKLQQDDISNACTGIIYAKCGDDRYKALEFTIQSASFDEVV